jgi:GNAT superfamily N-acetyltransferase
VSPDCRYPATARALYDALVDDGFYRTLESVASPDAAMAKHAMLRYLDYSMTEAEEYGRLCFPDDRSAGAAIWSLPREPAIQRSVSSRKKAFITEHMGERCCDVYTAITGFMHTHTMTVVAADCWYLSIIGIAPALQGRGQGAALMNAVLGETDRAGIGTFLETFTPRNELFYERLGYITRARFLEPTIGAPYAVMSRGPAKHDIA